MNVIEPIRCVCGNWLGVQAVDHVECRHRARQWSVRDGSVTCERCGSVTEIENGRPVRAPVGLVAR